MKLAQKLAQKLALAALPLAALIPLAATAATQLAPAETMVQTAAVTPTCAAIPIAAPEGAKIESVQAEHHQGGTVEFPATPFAMATTITDVPAYCEIIVALTHPGANDHVKVTVTLPETGWTGRLQAIGGSSAWSRNVARSRSRRRG